MKKINWWELQNCLQQNKFPCSNHLKIIPETHGFGCSVVLLDHEKIEFLQFCPPPGHDNNQEWSAYNSANSRILNI